MLAVLCKVEVFMEMKFSFRLAINQKMLWNVFLQILLVDNSLQRKYYSHIGQLSKIMNYLLHLYFNIIKKSQYRRISDEMQQ